MITLKRSVNSLLVILLAWQLNCQAQNVKMYTGKAPSAEEMGEILFAQPEPSLSGGGSGVKMRSISFGKPSKQDVPKTSTEEKSSAIGLPIKFGYNSAIVLVESEPFLNAVGRMLSMASFENEKIVIEGHTDARGTEKYNHHLSEKRAKSIKTYLNDNYKIDDGRLFIVGMGESQPLQGVDPFSAINRRVQIRKASAP